MHPPLPINAFRRRTSLVPPFIEHYLIWSILPIIPDDVPSIIKTRLHQDGLWGFSGYTPDSPPPSPSLLPACLPALSDWCVTEASLTRTPRGTEEEEIAVREAGSEVHKFVTATWKEREWETAWFVNPPVSTLCNEVLNCVPSPITALAVCPSLGTYPCVC